MEIKEDIMFNWITKNGPYLSLCLMVFGLVLHISGVSTSYWLEGNRLSGPQNNADVVKVNVGLFSQKILYRNWTVENTDSSLTIQTPQCVILTTACISTILCTVTVVRSIHVIVGTSGFIAMPLLFVSLVLSSGDMEANLVKVQTGQATISWSYHLVFARLLINTLSTALFLALQLVKKELEAKSTRLKSSDLSKCILSTTGF